MPSPATERFPLPAPGYSDKLLGVYRQAIPEIVSGTRPFNLMVSYKAHKGETSEVRLAVKHAGDFWLVAEETYEASMTPRIQHLVNLNEGVYACKKFDLESSPERCLVAAAEEARWDRGNPAAQELYGQVVSSALDQLLSENRNWREFTQEAAEQLGFHIE